MLKIHNWNEAEALSSLEANFFADGIDKLVSRYDKCLNRFGDYVEK
jgi:hypothetical protein